MKTIYILRSELDDSLLVKSTDNLKKALKPYQKIKKIGKLEIPLWELVCSIEFSDDRQADNFEKFLLSKDGMEFIIQHLARNPLLELEKLLKVLPKSFEFFVIGGLAIDGYVGKFSRLHNDADLMCWRKDVNTAKTAIRKLGYEVKTLHKMDGSKTVTIVETEEENPIISFLLMDEKPKGCFAISIGKNFDQLFPKKYLGSKKVKINSIEFPVVSLAMLNWFNKNTKAHLNIIKKDNPKLYKILGPKINNNKSDRKLLNKLMGK